MALRVEDIVAIEQLKARYFRCVDDKAWDELRSLFTEECRFEMRAAPHGQAATPGAGVAASDPDGFVAQLRERLEAALTVHHGHSPEISITGPDEASGIWPMYTVVRRPAGSPYPSFKGFGRYHERYRRVDGEWRIHEVILERITFEPEPPLPD